MLSCGLVWWDCVVGDWFSLWYGLIYLFYLLHVDGYVVYWVWEDWNDW